MSDYVAPTYNNIIIGAGEDETIYTAPTYNNIIITDEAASGTGRYAIVIYQNKMVTISSTLLGTGLQPVVIESDGKIHTRATTEGTPIVDIDGKRATLPEGDYLLI